MVRYDTPEGWTIGPLLSPAIQPQCASGGHHGQARRLLRLLELALDLSRVEALRRDRQETQCERHDLACRFRLVLCVLGWPAAAQARAATPSLSHDGAEALARPTGRQPQPRTQVLSRRRSAGRQVR